MLALLHLHWLWLFVSFMKRNPVVNVSSSGYQPAVYHAGNGTAHFVFLYTVQPGDQTGDLEYWDEGAFKTEGFVRRATDMVGEPTYHTIHIAVLDGRVFPPMR